MTSRDDATRAAVAPLLADLRGDLLVMPQEHIVEQHLEMMAFEERVLATPRFVQKRARQRMPHPRRALVAFLCAFTTLVSCGLSAAGALPAPLQHITESIAHTFGVPRPDNPPPLSNGKAAGEPAAERPAPQAAPTTTTKPAVISQADDTHKVPSTSKPTVTTTPPTIALPDPQTPIATSRPHVPSTRVTPDDPGRPPSKNSSNTPPGFPADWRAQAATAAAAQLVLICPQATTPTQIGCPQQASAPDLDPLSQSLQWSIFNQPYDGAAVIAKTTPGNPARGIAPKTAVTVYEAFQMAATYTAADGATHYAYSGGIGAATMTWNGSMFVNASFGPGSVAGQLLPGVKAPTLPRPTNFDNTAVLGALSNGFAACTAITPAEGPTPTCPQTSAAGEQWTVTGDPAQGAVVAYDSTRGLFTVTGTYAMTSNLGNTTGGAYTATLFFDATQLQVVGIAAN
jgi:hypothetical protein